MPDLDPDSGNDDDLGRRWYPTATTLADGRVLVTDGDDNVYSTLNSGDYPIVFDPNAPAGSQYSSLTNAYEVLNWYPFVFQRTNGQVFMGGSNYTPVAFLPPDSSQPVSSRNLNVAFQAWSSVTDAPIKGCTAAMYRVDKVMKAGGALTGGSANHFDNVPLTARAMTINLNAASPQYCRVGRFDPPVVDQLLPWRSNCAVPMSIEKVCRAPSLHDLQDGLWLLSQVRADFPLLAQGARLGCEQS